MPGSVHARVSRRQGACNSDQMPGGVAIKSQVGAESVVAHGLVEMLKVGGRDQLLLKLLEWEGSPVAEMQEVGRRLRLLVDLPRVSKIEPHYPTTAQR
jgi:hypothetical protein